MHISLWPSKDATPGANGITPGDEPASTRDVVAVGLVVAGAFAVYFASAFALEARRATELFGADTGLYIWLGQGNQVDRITRFHPLSTFLIVAWMKLFSPLTAWVAPVVILKALFAAIGALGVWAAMWAFAAVMPRRYVPFWGVIYAASLGSWYFASIEESKIITATLSALYLGAYVHLRARWSIGRLVLLTGILLLACLNEIVAGFLVIVPAIDALMHRGINLRHDGWIVLHALVAPAVLAFLELFVNGHLAGTSTDPEQASHLSMLLFYLDDNDFSWSTTATFLQNWLFFNIAAPTRSVTHAFPQWPTYYAFFAPGLGGYLSTPWAVLLALSGGAIAVGWITAMRWGSHLGLVKGLLLGLVAYGIVRGAFFYIFNPNECLLFSPSVTLAHLILIGVPFSASRIPGKPGLLGLVAVLLLINNGVFITGV